jgi:hypothetical protein
MERLTQAQLQQVVAEVQRLSFKQQEELDAEQVKQILKEIDLPPELLDEAMIQLQRKEALVVEEKRNRWIVGVSVGAVAVVLAGSFFFLQTQQQNNARVTVQGARFTLTQDRNEKLSTISRSSGEISYRVTLADAPLGQKLSLSCNWIAPNGQTVHQNRFQTKEVTTSIWNTACRYSPGQGGVLGAWEVQAFLGDRLLSKSTFVLTP